MGRQVRHLIFSAKSSGNSKKACDQHFPQPVGLSLVEDFRLAIDDRRWQGEWTREASRGKLSDSFIACGL